MKTPIQEVNTPLPSIDKIKLIGLERSCFSGASSSFTRPTFYSFSHSTPPYYPQRFSAPGSLGSAGPYCGQHVQKNDLNAYLSNLHAYLGEIISFPTL